MGLFQRFWTMLKSQLNHLIGQAEDPEKMLNQTLLDMQEQLMTAKRQVAVAIADEKRLIQQYEQEKQNSSDWEQRAVHTVNKALMEAVALVLVLLVVLKFLRFFHL